MMKTVEEVKAHALAHYDEGGWDVIVECWDDAYIQEVLDGPGGVDTILGCVAVWADQQADARNSAF